MLPPSAASVSPVRTPAKAVPENVIVAAAPKKTEGSATERAKRLYVQGLAKREQGQVQALPLFRQAAELGDPRAMVELGEAVLAGDGPEKDEALRWFRKAAATGDTLAMLNLGVMYDSGNGVSEDYEVAVSWYAQAAAGGNPPAMYNLGRMYEKGRGVARNLAKAQELYRRSAALGNTSAKTRLSQLAPGAK
jgi:TPR repeat protein